MYQHKEPLSGKRADAYMDVYALGCIALELYSKKRVWEDILNAAQLDLESLLTETCGLKIVKMALNEASRENRRAAQQMSDSDHG